MLKYLFVIIFLFNSLCAFASGTDISNDDKQYMIEYINGMYSTIENINQIKNKKYLSCDELMNDFKKQLYIPSEKETLAILNITIDILHYSVSKNKNKIKSKCQEYKKYIDVSEKENKEKIKILTTILNENDNICINNMLKDENTIRNMIVENMIELQDLYGYYDPNSLKIKILKSEPIDIESNNIIYKIYGKFNIKNKVGGYVGYKDFTALILTTSNKVSNFQEEDQEDLVRRSCNKVGVKF